jgi:glycerol-3-phosphate dehydrogenase
MVPIGTVAILGTTDIHVADPDEWEITRAEVDELLDEGEKLFPQLRRMRLLRAYGGVRPLYDPGETGSESRDVTRAHAVLDHATRDGVSNFTSIVGGKLTTYRLMAQDTADVVARKAGVTARATTAGEPIPDRDHGGTRYHWLGARFAEHEAHGGGDAALVCECELVTRSMLGEVLDRRWPCSLDDVRRATRLGMGPCQGGFCTFRAAGAVADHAARVTGDPLEIGDTAEQALADFLRERQRGTQPIAHGRQLQEAVITAGFHWGTLGLDSLVGTGAGGTDAKR